MSPRWYPALRHRIRSHRDPGLLDPGDEDRGDSDERWCSARRSWPCGCGRPASGLCLWSWSVVPHRPAAAGLTLPGPLAPAKNDQTTELAYGETRTRGEAPL